MFLTSAIVIIFCYLAGRHVLGIFRSEVPAQDGGWWLPVVMSVSALSSICCIVIDVEFPVCEVLVREDGEISEDEEE